MKNILKEFFISDAYANSDLDPKNHDFMEIYRYKSTTAHILKTNQITSSQFEKSLDYYLYKDPDLPEFFESISKDLNELKIKYQKDSTDYRKKDSLAHPEKWTRAKQIQDSLRKINLQMIQRARGKDSLLKIQQEYLKKIKSRHIMNRTLND